MENKDIYEDISSIKTIMERSAKFISLSGLAGVMAGIYALAGVAVLYFLSNKSMSTPDNSSTDNGLLHSISETINKIIVYMIWNPWPVIIIGLAVLVLSIGTGTLLTRYKAIKKGQRVWNESSRALLKSAIVPLVTGALIILIAVLWYRFAVLVFPISLIFYGLALTAASKYTYGDVKWLGFLEILLGLSNIVWMNCGILFWAIGFGVLHILYGTIMYFKYDRGNNAA